MKGDIDDVKRAMAALLAGPTFLAALQAAVVEKADGVAPMPPAVVYQEERLSPLVYPACEVIGLRTIYPDQDLVKAAQHEIAVFWTATSDTEAKTTRFIELLVRATTDVLWGVTLDMAVANGPLLVREEDYSPLMKGPQQPYLKSGRVMVTVPTWRS